MKKHWRQVLLSQHLRISRRPTRDFYLLVGPACLRRGRGEEPERQQLTAVEVLVVNRPRHCPPVELRPGPVDAAVRVVWRQHRSLDMLSDVWRAQQDAMHDALHTVLAAQGNWMSEEDSGHAPTVLGSARRTFWPEPALH
ncbi:hypothetical protein [Streptomyces mirabilis]|uniref:hypothetical protein n=1 Tax=Streptomyces mirabilis TaxID=68239 RepID=UPI0036DD2C91